MSLLKKKKIDYLNQAIVDKDSLSKWNNYAVRTGETKVKRSSLGYQDNFLKKLFGLEKKKPTPKQANTKRKSEKETALSKPKVKLFKKKGKDMTMWS
ncbi:MAG: hypothetical protein WCF78_02340 [archaeon]